MKKDRECKVDDCDLRHCTKCGGHNYEPGNICDACQVEQASDTTAQIVEGFGGNWEEAAKTAIETAKKSLQEMRVAEVTKMDVNIDDGKLTYRVKLKVSFKYQD